MFAEDVLDRTKWTIDILATPDHGKSVREDGALRL